MENTMTKLSLSKETLRILNEDVSTSVLGGLETLDCETGNATLCICAPDTRHVCQPNTSGGIYC
jgi:hypothetical protein